MENAPNEIRIVQYNCNLRPKTTQSLLDDLDPYKYHIIALQEPYTERKPRTAHHKNYKHVRCPNVGPKGIGACFFISKTLPMQYWQESTFNEDLLSIRITLENNPPLWIHNIYHRGPFTKTTETSPLLQELTNILTRPGKHVLLGDFNLHHQLWGGDQVTEPHALSEQLIQITLENNMVCATERGKHTWAKKGKRPSTLDLTFMDIEIADNCLLNCSIDDTLNHGSDHRPVVTTLHNLNIPPITPTLGRNYKKADWEKIREVCSQKYDWEKGGKLILRTKEEIDQEVGKIIKAIQEAMEEIPQSKPCRYSRPGWTPRCSELVKEAKRACRKFHRHRTEENHRTMRDAISAKTKEIRKEKGKEFRRFVSKASESDNSFWGLTRWATKLAGLPPTIPQLPPMRRTEEESQLHFDNEAKTEILAERLFPAPIETDLTDIPNTTYPTPVKIEQKITEKDVREVIAKPSPYKTPGPDKIPNKALKELCTLISPTLANLFNACLSVGYHPIHFKHSITAIIKKPQKPDYTLPGAYRPIALLSTIGKLLERIVAERLSIAADQHQLLPNTQMGARKNRSTITALHLLTEQIHTIWKMDPKAIVTMLSLDMTGAYDRVSHERLIHNLRQKKIPEWVTRYINSFLSERTTCLSFAGYTSKPITTRTGIPQGSALSPILFLYFVYELLENLQSHNSSSLGFVDDHNLLTWSRTTTANCARLEQMHAECITWAKRHGMTWNPEKYSIIHFTKQRRTNGLQLSAAPDIGMKDGPVPAVKVLGLWVDTKLSWKPHIQNTATKAIGKIAAMSRLLGSTWGATFKRSRLIYTAVIRPTIAYGCSVWYAPNTPARTQPRESTIRPLVTAQNKALRKITGAYRATPIPILEKEAGIEPLPLYMHGQAMKDVLKRNDSDGQRAIESSKARIQRVYQRQKGRPRRIKITPQEKLLAQAKQAEIQGQIVVTQNQARREEGRLKKAKQRAEEREKRKCLKEAREIRPPLRPNPIGTTSRPTVRLRDSQTNQPFPRNRGPRLVGPQFECKHPIDHWKHEQWKIKWEQFKNQQRRNHSPALDEAFATWEQIVPKLHEGLTRPQSSLATLLRTEVIGFNAFLHKRKVPGVTSQGCPCGGPYQNARHMVMDCPLNEEGREEMLEEAGSRNFSILMNEPKGIKSCVRWVMRKRLLTQFSYAQDIGEGAGKELHATRQDEQNEIDLEASEIDDPANDEPEAHGSEEEESEMEET
jgi:exonuclease III